MIGAASVHADLVFHVLAFVPAPAAGPALSRAASLHWPAWIRFSEAAMPGDAVEAARRDAAILSAFFAAPEVASTLQILAVLFDDLEGARACALRSVAELTDAEVASPWARRALAALPAEPVEIARIAVALAAEDFAEAHARAIAPFAEAALARLAARWPDVSAHVRALASADVRFSPALGPRGRGIGDVVFVGTSSVPGDEVDVETPLVLAVHESAVRCAGRVVRAHGLGATWALAERVAIDAERLVAQGSPLGAAHSAWLDALDLSALAPPSAETERMARETAGVLLGDASA